MRQIQRFKTLLEVRHHELRLSIEHQQRYARHIDTRPDEIDRASSGHEKESSTQQTNREKVLLRMIESALSRIRDGSFGKCLSCGNEIDVKRLLAVPWTRYCIQCQEDMER
jgi:DnaK suppressor protein